MPALQQPFYHDQAELDAALAKLHSLPPLVTSWEIESLKRQIAEAGDGKRFILQGGDCAESLAECTSNSIAGKLKILLQMSLVLVMGAKKPVTRIGRIAGQYAKPRSSPTESRTLPDGSTLTLPSYFGDLVNEPAFTSQARTPQPHLLVSGYQHAGLTLNFIRSLIDAGFADLHHPEYWDLGFASASPFHREYRKLTDSITDSIGFMEKVVGASLSELARVEFFTSHEGLHLLYESAATRTVPRRSGFYNLATHFPWIGNRTRALDGAHVEYFRGIANPIGVKVGPPVDFGDIARLVERLNPGRERGKITIIHRFGADSILQQLPDLIDRVAKVGVPVTWMCDPMHGNTVSTQRGVKTRSFDAILHELRSAFDVHERIGVPLGGVHFELTGEPVTECLGGTAGPTEQDLGKNYKTSCDPRLNNEQALEMAFLIARRVAGAPT